MPFDPTKPLDHTLGTAAEMRAQLLGLRDLIGTVYQNQNVKTAAKIWTAQTTVTGVAGQAYFYPTDDGTPTGNSLFTNIYSVQATCERAALMGNPVNAFVSGVDIAPATVTIYAHYFQTNMGGGLTAIAAAPFGTVVHCTIIGD